MDPLPPRKNETLSILKDTLTGIGLCLVIFYITLYLPLLGFLMAVVLPMPVLFYRLKLGRNTGFVMAAVTLGIIAAASQERSIDVLFYGALLATGLVMGTFIEQNLSPAKIGAYTCAVVLGLVLFIVGSHAIVTGRDLIGLVTGYVGTHLELTLQLYQNMGVPPENMAVIIDAMDTIEYVLVRILPALITAMLMVVIWGNILFIKRILARRQIHPTGLADLSRWTAPAHLVWLAIICGILLLIPVKWVKIVGLNCIITLIPVYFFQGIAVVSFFFEKKKFPRMLRIFIYSIIALQQIFLLVVVGMGFFDTWINFRKIKDTGPTE